MAEKTLFEKIIEGQIPADIVYKDDVVTAFKDIAPKAPIHILIVTNKPIPSIAQCEDCDEAAMGHLFIVAKKIAKELNINEDGYRLIVNVGKHGGQEVPHLHMHLLGGTQLGALGFTN